MLIPFLKLRNENQHLAEKNKDEAEKGNAECLNKTYQPSTMVDKNIKDMTFMKIAMRYRQLLGNEIKRPYKTLSLPVPYRWKID